MNKVFPWPEFDRDEVEREIEERRQWKMVIDNQIACIWSTTFDDPLIWEVQNADPAVYIHRIATHPAFRGNNLVSKIVQWAVKYAKTYNKRFVRMDTVGRNEKLIGHYEKCGFSFWGAVQTKKHCRVTWPLSPCHR